MTQVVTQLPFSSSRREERNGPPSPTAPRAPPPPPALRIASERYMHGLFRRGERVATPPPRACALQSLYGGPLRLDSSKTHVPRHRYYLASGTAPNCYSSFPYKNEASRNCEPILLRYVRCTYTCTQLQFYNYLRLTHESFCKVSKGSARQVSHFRRVLLLRQIYLVSLS